MTIRVRGRIVSVESDYDRQCVLEIIGQDYLWMSAGWTRQYKLAANELRTYPADLRAQRVVCTKLRSRASRFSSSARRSR